MIDITKGIVVFCYKENLITCKIINKSTVITKQNIKLMNNIIKDICGKPIEQIPTEQTEDELWQQKIEELMSFKSTSPDEQLTENQLQNLADIYQRYRHVFSEHPGKAKNFQCKLKFKDNVSFNRKSYPIAHSLKDQVREEINRMIEEDIVEWSCLPYTSPLVTVRKKKGKVRLCLDAREMNRLLINDRTSPDNIEEIIKKFHGLKYITLCDATCGYWQIELHPNSRQYVAFKFEGRNYQFKRLPFGLINSVTVFIKCMDQVLGRDALDFTTVYVDDLLITSKTWTEHCERIRIVLHKLEENNITLKLKKSKLLTDRTNFLGFTLSAQGIKPSEEKVEAIQNFPTPRDVKQLQSFLGLCNYYRKFQKNHSHLTAQFQPQLSQKNK